MTLRDWGRFARVQLGLPVNGHRLLLPASLARLQTPVGGPLPEPLGGSLYALGWVILEIDGARLLAHDGSNGAWLSRIAINPSNQRTLLLSCNEGSARAEAALDQVARHPAIARWLLGR